MKHFFQKKELVVSILDADLANHKFVFPSLTGTADSRLYNAIKGSGPAFVKAHSTSDRRSEYIYVNPRRILSFTEKLEVIPADIEALMADYQLEEDEEKLEFIEFELKNYFEQG